LQEGTDGVGTLVNLLHKGEPEETIPEEALAIVQKHAKKSAVGAKGKVCVQLFERTPARQALLPRLLLHRQEGRRRTSRHHLQACAPPASPSCTAAQAR